jgi:arachidonate 15-lipoxygenase
VCNDEIVIILVLKMSNTSPQEEYTYNNEVLSSILPDAQGLSYPMVSAVFLEDQSLTKLDWTKDVASILLRIQSNQAMYDVAIQRGSFYNLIWYIRLSRLLKNPQNADWIEWLYKKILCAIQWLYRLFKKTPKSEDIEGDVLRARRPNTDAIPMVQKRITSMVNDIQKQAYAPSKKVATLSLLDYQDLFQIIYLPNIANRATDRDFAEQRVAGANPLVIHRPENLTDITTKFPITNVHYQSVMGVEDSLEQAIAEKRLYVTDYQALEIIQPAIVEIPTGKVQKYIYQPIALFAMEPGDFPHRRLMPVAIQCDQKPSAHNPIFVSPSRQSTTAERWAWQMAKLVVQIADGNYHEFISHLGGTHLWMEPVAISIYRKLPIKHPLGALLLQHVEGTLFINDAAVKGLINVKGTVAKVAAGTLESSLLLAIQSATESPFISLPESFQQRGVNDTNVFPDYPYRDDALLLWYAINEWVSSYLKIFYVDDQTVQKDQVIQDWIADLTAADGGQMSGIGEKTEQNSVPQIKTLDYLTAAVTLIIFTGTVQHAAVNFPQSSLMTYMPNMPLAGYRAAPENNTDMTENDYLAMLPSLAQSETQMNMTYLLGSVYYTRLGYYDNSYFTDSRVIVALQKFLDNLGSIEVEINARNEVRPTYYDVLLPSKIPQSINI